MNRHFVQLADNGLGVAHAAAPLRGQASDLRRPFCEGAFFGEYLRGAQASRAPRIPRPLVAFCERAQRRRVAASSHGLAVNHSGMLRHHVKEL